MLRQKHKSRKQNDNYGSITPSCQLILGLQAIPSSQTKMELSPLLQ
jgi:hypothetical protein